MEIRSIRTEEMEEWFDLMEKAYIKTTKRDYFTNSIECDPYYDNKYNLVTSVDNKLVASVRIFDRTMRLGEETAVRMGGIGNVACPPEYTAKGYVMPLLKKSIEIMRSEKMDASLLFTGINDYYQVFKWTTVTTPNITAKIDGQEKPERFCEIDLLKSVDEMNEIFSRASKSFLGIEERKDSKYWKAVIKFKIFRFKIIGAGIRENGRLVSYVIYTIDSQKNSVKILEIFSIPGKEKSMRALVSGIAGTKGRDVVFPFDEDHDLIKMLKSENIKYGIDRTSSGVNSAMIKITNLPSLVEQCLPEWEKRLKKSGEKFPEINFRIYDNKEPVALRIRKKSLKVVIPEKNMPEVTSLKRELPFLLFFPGKFIETKKFPEDLSRVLKIIFPAKPFFYSGLDSF